MQPGLRLTATLASVATVALVGALMRSPLGGRVAMPGPLASHHAMLREDCGACHAESADAIQSAWRGLVSSELDLEQSALCRRCHDHGPDALAPHDWASRVLAAHRGSSDEPRPVPEGPSGEVACAVCHREHRGRTNDLDAMPDGRCQACHSRRFEGLDAGHPALEGYPYRRRTRIVFDHASHVLRHFRGEQADLAPDACTDCHELDPGRGTMATPSFERGCAACHLEEVRGAGQVDGAGIAVLGLPALDTFAIEEHGMGIGRWPADAAWSELEPPAFLEVLLSTDEGSARDVSALRGLDLLDLAAADDEQLALVQRVAWGIKALLADVSRHGHAAVQERLRAAVGDALPEPLLRDACAGLPRALIQTSLESWLPGLDEELGARRGDASPATDSEPVDGVGLDRDRAREAWVDAGGWYARSLDGSIRYRPGGHADPFLTAWIEIATRAGGGPGREAAARLVDRLTARTSVGVCAKCHSVDARDGTVHVNWKGGPADAVRGLTAFSHGVHLTIASDHACLGCHRLASDGEAYARAFEQRDPGVFHSSFEPMTLATCTECHTSRGACQACLTCHRYHTFGPLPERVRAPLAAVAGPVATEPPGR